MSDALGVMNSATGFHPRNTGPLSSPNGDPRPAARALAKPPGQIIAEMLGFPSACVEAALRFRESGKFEDFSAMLPGMISFHLPRRAPRVPEVLTDGLRLKEDLGLDSLALTEMVFKLEDLFGIPIETREVFGLATVGDMRAFLQRKLDQP